MKLVLDLAKGEMIFDRSWDLKRKSDIRKCNLQSVMKEKLELHIFLDSSSIEIFTDDYAIAMTNVFYLPEEVSSFKVKAVGGSVLISSWKCWNLNSIK